MYAAECVTECDKADGTKCQPGDIIIHHDAWMLCMPGYRNEEPRFTPADEDTAEKVSAEMAKRQPIVDQTKKDLQRRINAYAQSGRFKIDPNTGFFKRDANGVVIGKMSKLEMHVIEMADGYKLKPELAEAAAKAAPKSESSAEADAEPARKAA